MWQIPGDFSSQISLSPSGVASELGAFPPASPSAFNNHNFFEFDGFEHRDRSIITYSINL